MPKVTDLISKFEKAAETKAPEHKDKKLETKPSDKARTASSQEPQETSLTNRSTVKRSGRALPTIPHKARPLPTPPVKPKQEMVKVDLGKSIQSLKSSMLKHIQKDLNHLPLNEKIEKVLGYNLDKKLTIDLLRPSIESELKNTSDIDDFILIFQGIKKICSYDMSPKEGPFYSHELFSDHFQAMLAKEPELMAKESLAKTIAQYKNFLKAENFYAKIDTIQDPDIAEMFGLWYNCTITNEQDLKAFCQNPNYATKLHCPLELNNLEFEELAEGIAKNKSLSVLLLNCTDIVSPGFGALADALKETTSLKTLRLENGLFEDDQANYLAEVIAVSTSITNLELTSSIFANAGVVFLNKFLTGNQTLSHLQLNDCRMNGEGIAELTQALKVNEALTSLELNSMDIANDDRLFLAQSLAATLLVNKTLTTLDLSSNSLRDNSATAIAEALRGNTTLTTLNLHGNKIGDPGAVALANTLIDNQTLKTLDLSNNRYTNTTAIAFIQSMNLNQSLTHLNLDSGFNISIDSKVTLRRLEKTVPSRKFIL
ncbi:MAG: hypothetical protein KBE16_00890 [Alphaproteobacteria bacterium]|jgi:hypothetical protein|nr:hypothetical protein [Alphaproteobacteria bacterium]MBP9878059.1 hypothetical protein [Alphaproteobacteria bacterium]